MCPTNNCIYGDAIQLVVGGKTEGPYVNYAFGHMKSLPNKYRIDDNKGKERTERKKSPLTTAADLHSSFSCSFHEILAE